MSEEGEILCLGAVRLSLYQCPPPSTAMSASHSSDDSMKAYRGDVLIPFYKGSTTYKDLMEGMEFRLNQYSVLHISPDSGDPDSGAQRQLPVHTREAAMTDESCCFTGAYLCPQCSGNGALSISDVSTPRKRKRSAGGAEYPKITVRHFTRAPCVSSAADSPPPPPPAPVSTTALVTEDDLCCFFSCALAPSPAEFAPPSATSRPVVGRDHVRAYASDSAYGDASPRRIEVRMGARLLRVGVSAGQRFADVFERLRRRRLFVRRLFDGASGASILPCELVRHLSWRVAALCAEAAAAEGPGGGPGGPGAAASLISLSEAPGSRGGSRGIGLESSASGTSASGWRRERLRHQRSFGFGEGEDTVVVNLLSPVRRLQRSRSRSWSDTGPATQELSAGDTPFRAVYLDEESYGDGASISPTHEDETETQTWWTNNAEELPIIVTQQALPDFYGVEEEEEEEDKEEANKESDKDSLE